MVPTWRSHVTRMPKIQLSSPRSVISYFCFSASLSLFIFCRSLETMVMSCMFNAMVVLDKLDRVEHGGSACVHVYPICLRVSCMYSYESQPHCFIPYTALASLRTMPSGRLKPGGGSMYISSFSAPLR